MRVFKQLKGFRSWRTFATLCVSAGIASSSLILLPNEADAAGNRYRNKNAQYTDENGVIQTPEIVAAPELEFEKEDEVVIEPPVKAEKKPVSKNNSSVDIVAAPPVISVNKYSNTGNRPQNPPRLKASRGLRIRQPETEVDRPSVAENTFNKADNSNSSNVYVQQTTPVAPAPVLAPAPVVPAPAPAPAPAPIETTVTKGQYDKSGSPVVVAAPLGGNSSHVAENNSESHFVNHSSSLGRARIKETSSNRASVASSESKQTPVVKPASAKAAVNPVAVASPVVAEEPVNVAVADYTYQKPVQIAKAPTKTKGKGKGKAVKAAAKDYGDIPDEWNWFSEPVYIGRPQTTSDEDSTTRVNRIFNRINTENKPSVETTPVETAPVAVVKDPVDSYLAEHAFAAEKNLPVDDSAPETSIQSVEGEDTVVAVEKSSQEPVVDNSLIVVDENSELIKSNDTTVIYHEGEKSVASSESNNGEVRALNIARAKLEKIRRKRNNGETANVAATTERKPGSLKNRMNNIIEKRDYAESITVAEEKTPTAVTPNVPDRHADAVAIPEAAKEDVAVSVKEITPAPVKEDTVATVNEVAPTIVPVTAQVREINATPEKETAQAPIVVHPTAEEEAFKPEYVVKPMRPMTPRPGTVRSAVENSNAVKPADVEPFNVASGEKQASYVAPVVADDKPVYSSDNSTVSTDSAETVKSEEASTEGKDFKPYIGVFGYSADKRMKNLKWKNKWTKKH